MGPLLDAFDREGKKKDAYFCPHTQKGSTRRVQPEANTPSVHVGHPVVWVPLLLSRPQPQRPRTQAVFHTHTVGWGYTQAERRLTKALAQSMDYMITLYNTWRAHLKLNTQESTGLLVETLTAVWVVGRDTAFLILFVLWNFSTISIYNLCNQKCF